MRTIFFSGCVCLLFAILQPLSAQNANDDPLAESYHIHSGGGDEIIGIRSYSAGGGQYDISIEVHKYFKEMEYAQNDTILKTLHYLERTHGSAWKHDLTTLDASGYGISDIVAAWASNNGIEIVALRADPARLSMEVPSEWEKVTRLTITYPAIPSPGYQFSGPVLASGDFTGDGTEEFVLGYYSIDDEQETWLNLALYDVNVDLELTQLDWIMEYPMAYSESGRSLELTVGDFNGDGRDELLVVGDLADDQGGWNVFADLYSYETEYHQLTQTVHETIFSQPDSEKYLVNLHVLSGYLNSSMAQQAVVGFSETQWFNGAYEGGFSSVYMIALSFDEFLSQMTVSEPFIREEKVVEIDSPGLVQRMTIGGDISGNGFEEILSGIDKTWATPSQLDIYQLNEQLQFINYANLDSLIDRRVVHLGKLTTDTTGLHPVPELFVASFPNTLVYSFDIDDQGAFQGLTLVTSIGQTYQNMTLAELDGDVRLGSPSRSSITRIMQPLVVLNAPPIHFDVLGGNHYDVSKSYNQNVGKFISSYTKESSQAVEVQTEINKDWGISATLSTSHSFFGVSVRSHLTTEYGERFSKKGGSSSTVTVGIGVDAREDDRVYATVIDYDVWEYPVFVSGIERGHVLVVDPVAIENRWFPSKSWSGYSYIPNHEVGNVLSYREYPLLADNPEVDELIKGDYNNSFVLDGNSSYDWSLQFDDFEDNEVSTQKEFGMDWGASISGWGVSASISGHYSREEINTQRTTVSEGLGIHVHFDAVDMSLGEVSYRVTPYAYWAKNGALVIDYAVQPELAMPGFSDTWWQVHYNERSDPGFIMPWRYDPEKGFKLEFPEKRYQTKDITFFPEDPEAGELVTITARVHNFSLIPTPGLVGVSFYIGDPDDGGTLIVGEGNVTKVYTDSAIPARGRRKVEMKWRVPNDIGTFPRIYGLIDPDQSIPEIHDNNNKGWTVLGKTTEVGVEDVADLNLPVKFALKQNYPNPFNPGTMIEFSIPKSERVTLSVFNILGQRVATLVSGQLEAGTHSHYWDASGLASGVYMYRIEAGGYVETKSMMFVK